MSRDYRLIVAPRTFDDLKQISAQERSFEGKYASIKNIKFPRGNFQDVNTLLSLLVTTKFSCARQFKKSLLIIEFNNLVKSHSYLQTRRLCYESSF